MFVLALETATDAAGVAVADEEGVRVAITSARRRRHAETLVPAIQSACSLAGAPLGRIASVAVDVGPGLFTGLRVGVGTAKALAFALEIPVAAASSLEIMAWGATRTMPVPLGGTIVPVVDARRGEVFWATFRVGSDGAPHRQGAERVGPPQVLAEELEGAGALVLGDGARRYEEIFEGVAGTVAGRALSSPSPGVLAELGVEKLRSGDVRASRDVAPLYLREADVRINWESRRPSRSEPEHV